MGQEHFLLEGVIIPNEWDERGQIKTISLSTNSEQVLPIVMDEMGLRLMDCLQSLVRAKAVFLECESGRRIQVRSFKKISFYSL